MDNVWVKMGWQSYKDGDMVWHLLDKNYTRCYTTVCNLAMGMAELRCTDPPQFERCRQCVAIKVTARLVGK